jgi:hypothetical protein
MAKGYAEGPAAEEAERRLDEAASPLPPPPPVERAALFGCTEDETEPHFLGWADEVDGEALFVSGRAWGIVVRRVSADRVPSG